jgi:hypothetical protein
MNDRTGCGPPRPNIVPEGRTRQSRFRTVREAVTGRRSPHGAEPERASAAEGSSLWTGTVHGDRIEGKLVVTKSGGAVLIYAFKGYKLD